MSQSNRPVFLNLAQIRLPLNALVSILHRVSGLFMFLTLPVVYCWLACVLDSPAYMNSQDVSMGDGLWPYLGFVVILAWIYHALAGVRHLIMDFGYCESLYASRVLSWVVLVVFAAVAVYLGVCLWSPM